MTTRGGPADIAATLVLLVGHGFLLEATGAAAMEWMAGPV